MKILKIEVLSRNNKSYALCMGIITIGNFYESFYMDVGTWNLEGYKHQWKEGFKRIKSYDSSCLIANITSYEHDELAMNIYYLYKINNIIYVQNQIIYTELFKEISIGLPPFTSKTCYQYVQPLKFYDEDGNKLETWEADLDGIIIE